MPKLQYYQDDLAKLLGVGKITQMFVVEENGNKILRIECTATPGNEYKTVTTKTAAKPKIKRQREEREPRQRNPEGLGAKLMRKVDDAWKNKNPPPWME